MRNIDRILIVAGVSQRTIPTEGIFQELVLMDQATGETLTFPLVPGQYELMQEFYAETEEFGPGEQDPGAEAASRANSFVQGQESGKGQDKTRGIGTSHFSGFETEKDWETAQATQEAGGELARDNDQGPGATGLRHVVNVERNTIGLKGLSDF